MITNVPRGTFALMFTVDLSSFKDSIRRIEYGITRVGIFHVDGFAMQSLKETYDDRVFEQLEGSLGQEIGLPPTPMHETGDLRSTFMVTRDGLDILDYGFAMEGLGEGQSMDGITDISQIQDQLYDAEIERSGPIFGPIWDLTKDEIEELEIQSERMFYKLYDGWL